MRAIPLLAAATSKCFFISATFVSIYALAYFFFRSVVLHLQSHVCIECEAEMARTNERPND